MTTVAATIQQAIDVCADNIAQITFDGVIAISTRMTAWITALFGPAGIFVDVADVGQRSVIDWRIATDMAAAAIEGPGAGQCGLVGCSAVIDAVSRTLCAIRDSALSGAITVAQRTATITAFNADWT